MRKIVSEGAPLYYQVKEYIKEDIENGTFRPGERIPAEPELLEQYQVSRITVRRAVEELCKEGLLEKRRGTGTFVRSHRITRKIENLMSFTDSCLASGMTASSRILHREYVPASSLDEEALKNEERVLYIRRLRLANEEPVMVENNYFPGERFAFLKEAELTGSLYRLLEEEHDIRVRGSRNSYLDIIRADQELASLLRVNAGDPLFYLHTEIYDEEGQLVHVGRQYINSERYRFYL